MEQISNLVIQILKEIWKMAQKLRMRWSYFLRTFWTIRTLKSVITSIFILIVMSLSVIGIYLIFGDAKGADKAKILLELTKSLLQLSIIVILGSVITLLLNSYERQRQGEKSLHDFREEFLKILHVGYQSILKSRLTLASEGLTTKFITGEYKVKKHQRDAYGEQMRDINQVQLDLENLEVEIGNFPDAFKDSEGLVYAIGKMRQYLMGLLDEYEQYWPKLQVEGEGEVKVEALKQLLDFTGQNQGSTFSKEVLDPYKQALALIRQGLLPLSRAKDDSKV